MVDYDSRDMGFLLWDEEHVVSCVLPLGHWIFFKLFWISIIVYIKQTGWSDHESSNHLQWENFVIPKVIVIICEGWSFMRGSNYVRALTGRIWCFGSVVAYERWSLTWGGLTWRFNCMCCCSFCNQHVILFLFFVKCISWL